MPGSKSRLVSQLFGFADVGHTMIRACWKTVCAAVALAVLSATLALAQESNRQRVYQQQVDELVETTIRLYHAVGCKIFRHELDVEVAVFNLRHHLYREHFRMAGTLSLKALAQKTEDARRTGLAAAANCDYWRDRPEAVDNVRELVKLYRRVH